jgi:hypothetical protein
MHDINMPVIPRLLEEWENQVLKHASKPDQQASKIWAYYFERWLLGHIKLGLVKQETKELKCIQAEGVG